MVRHPALRPLSEEHHHALVQARRLRWAAAGNDHAALTAAAHAFLAFWQSGGGQAHFRKEEELLLPALHRYAETNTVEIIHLLQQHIKLRRLAQDIEHELALGSLVAVATVQELADELHHHIRHEERVVFPAIEAAMPNEALMQLQLDS